MLFAVCFSTVRSAKDEAILMPHNRANPYPKEQRIINRRRLGFLPKGHVIWDADGEAGPWLGGHLRRRFSIGVFWPGLIPGAEAAGLFSKCPYGTTLRNA